MSHDTGSEAQLNTMIRFFLPVPKCSIYWLSLDTKYKATPTRMMPSATPGLLSLFASVMSKRPTYQVICCNMLEDITALSDDVNF